MLRFLPQLSRTALPLSDCLFMRFNVTLPARSTAGLIFSGLFSMVFVGIGAFFIIGYHLGLQWVPSGINPLFVYAFGGTFAAAGVWSFVRTLRSRRKHAESQKKLKKHADAPWRVRPEWRDPELVDEGTIDGALLGFAVLWNAISWPIGYVIVSDAMGAAEMDTGALFVLLFPLIGLGFAAAVGYQWLRARKYGKSRLELDRLPARLGRPVGGLIATGVDAGDGPEEGFNVQLTCFRQYVTYRRDSDGDRTKKIERDVKWRDEAHVRGRPHGNGSKLEVPFSFEIPDDALASTPLKKETRMLWEVQITADVPGIDYQAAFEIPVFPPDEVAQEETDPDAEESSGTPGAALRGDGAPGAEPAETAPSGRDEAGTDEPDAAPSESGGDESDSNPSQVRSMEAKIDAPVTEGVEVDRLAGSGVEVRLTPERNWKQSLMLGGIGLVLFASSFFAFGASYLLGLILFGVGGLMLYGGVQNLTNKTVVRVAAGQVAVTHSGIGMPDDVTFEARHLGGTRVSASSHGNDQSTYALFLLVLGGEAQEKAMQQAASTRKILRSFGLYSAQTKEMEGVRESLDEPSIRVASDLRHKGEAEWLARLIEDAAEREAAF